MNLALEAQQPGRRPGCWLPCFLSLTSKAKKMGRGVLNLWLTQEQDMEGIHFGGRHAPLDLRVVSHHLACGS
jgi:hypothetical protein